MWKYVDQNLERCPWGMSRLGPPKFPKLVLKPGIRYLLRPWSEYLQLHKKAKLLLACYCTWNNTFSFFFFVFLQFMDFKCRSSLVNFFTYNQLFPLSYNTAYTNLKTIVLYISPLYKKSYNMQYKLNKHWIYWTRWSTIFSFPLQIKTKQSYMEKG